jgi:hypothetical protein
MHTFRYAHHDVVKTVVSHDGMAFIFARGDLWKDPEIMKAAVTQTGLALNLLTRICNVKAAVGSNGTALRGWNGSPFG